MIETLKEYERAKYVSRMIMGPTTRKAMKTVDALIEIVKAADDLESTGRNHMMDEADHEDLMNALSAKLRQLLDNVPSWMKER